MYCSTFLLVFVFPLLLLYESFFAQWPEVLAWPFTSLLASRSLSLHRKGLWSHILKVPPWCSRPPYSTLTFVSLIPWYLYFWRSADEILSLVQMLSEGKVFVHQILSLQLQNLNSSWYYSKSSINIWRMNDLVQLEGYESFLASSLAFLPVSSHQVL